jgi:hypothetical protein
MLYADKHRTQIMSDMVDRKTADHNLRKLHKAAQYLYRWGFIETYTITKGMISGVWFDGYEKPERQTFDTIKWEVTVQNTWHINWPWYKASNDGYAHEHVTKDMGQFERDKMQINAPRVERPKFEGDLKWDNFKAKTRGNQREVMQDTTATLIRRIRRARKMPLFRGVFESWNK